MTIGEEAKTRYEKSEGEGSFAAALARCFFLGVVVKRPEFVLLAEEVLTDGKAIIAIGPECHPNCWWIYYAAAPKGTVTPCDFMDEAPYPLPYVGFKRRGKMKVYTWDQFKKGRSVVVCNS